MLKYSRVLFILFFLIYFLQINAQVHSDYVPIKLSEAGSNELKSILHRDISHIKAQKGSGNIDETGLYKATDLELKEYVKKGVILYDDTLSRYVASVANQLVVSRPSLRNQFKIYILKSTVSNAYTYANGAILVTTGLLAKLTSKSQLAFIIGHELGHLSKKHNEASFDKEFTLKKDFKLASEGNENTLQVLMHYSKEFEMEADAIGVELMNGAGFNGNEALKAIKILTPFDTSYKYVKIDIKKIFSSPDFNIDSALAHSSNNYSNYKDDGDDKLSTHPDLDKRYIAIKELLANMPGIITKEIPSDSINYVEISYVARMEDIQSAFESANYSGSFYLSLKEMQTDPNNKYLKLMVARNLVWLANYKDNNVLNHAMSDQNNLYGRRFKDIETFIKSLSSNDFKKLSYSYIKHNYNTSGKNEELSFYMAYISDFYLGGGVSRFYFNQYLKDYPNGKYTGYAENKLQ